MRRAIQEEALRLKRTRLEEAYSASPNLSGFKVREGEGAERRREEDEGGEREIGGEGGEDGTGGERTEVRQKGKLCPLQKFLRAHP